VTAGDFQRYLRAKRTVDDRALDGDIIASLRERLAERARRRDGPLRVLEVGAGVGTMVERLLAWDVLPPGETRYTAVDVNPTSVRELRHRLAEHATGEGAESAVDEGTDAAVAAGTEAAPDLFAMPAITLQKIFGYLFWPFAWAMGVPTQDCFHIATLLGEKMVVNELVAYSSLAQMLSGDIQLQHRSIVIATYALLGFANFGSIGIPLGGIGGIAPSRKHHLAEIALRAMIGGTLAAMLTATVAGILV
jgi:hypothetical protein